MASSWNENKYLHVKTVQVLIQIHNTGCCCKLQWTQLVIESNKCNWISSKKLSGLFSCLDALYVTLQYDKIMLLTYTFVLKVWEYKFLGALRQVYSVWDIILKALNICGKLYKSTWQIMTDGTTSLLLCSIDGIWQNPVWTP